MKASSKIILKVTLKCIKDGKPGNPGYCPVALAFKNIGYKNVHVFPDQVVINKSNQIMVLDLPESAQKFISEFDSENINININLNLDKFTPFSFEAEVSFKRIFGIKKTQVVYILEKTIADMSAMQVARNWK